MANNLNAHYFVFVIDTNKYAGNFERSMAWYITGFKPENMHGGVDWIGELARKEIAEIQGKSDRYPFDNVPYSIATEYGNAFVEMLLSPPPESEHHLPPGQQHRQYHSVGLYMEAVPKPKILKLMRERAKGFTKIITPDTSLVAEKGLKILGFRLLEAKLVTTEHKMETP